MPTVSQAVQMLEKTTRIPGPTIRGAARQLIDDGVLPKSSGRRIEAISPEQFIRLLISIYCAEAIKDATRASDLFYNLEASFVSRHKDNPLPGISCSKAGDTMTSLLEGFISEFYDFKDFGSTFDIEIRREARIINITSRSIEDSRKNYIITFANPDDELPYGFDNPSLIQPETIIRISLYFFNKIAELWRDIECVDAGYESASLSPNKPIM